MNHLTLSGNIAKLTGNIEFRTAMAVYHEGLKAFGDHGEFTLDFSDVSHVDSSAIAVLIEWMKHAKEKALTLHFAHFPGHMQRLMQLSELEDLLS